MSKLYTKRNKYTKEIIEQVVNKCSTIKECLIKLNRPTSGDNYAYFKRLTKKFNIDISHFISRTEQFKRKPYKGKLKWEDIFCENSIHRNGNSLKIILYKKGIKQPVCELCGQDEYWRGDKISLILDHINGINTDNRIENLRILCPNCNAATDTFTGKNRKDKKIHLPKVKIIGLKEKNRIELIEQIKNSDIDFNKQGWGLILSKTINRSPQFSRKLVRKYIPEVWNECWKHSDNKALMT